MELLFIWEHLLQNPLEAVSFGSIVVSFYVTFMSAYNAFMHPTNPFPGPILSVVSSVVVLFSLAYGGYLLSQSLGPTVANILKYSPALFVLHSTYAWFRNAYLDPLSKFPGPKLAAATPAYLSFWSYLGQRHTLVKRLHEKYGPVVRIAPNELSFISEGAWKDINILRQGGAQMQKAPKRNPRAEGHSIIEAPDDVHSRQRRVLAHAFSDKALREQEALIQSYMHLLIKKLGEAAREGRPVNMVSQLNWLTFDIIGDLAFSAPFGSLESQTQHPWMDIFWSTVKNATKLFQLTAVPLLFPLVLITSGPLRSSAVKHMKYTNDRVASRMKEIETQTSDRKDFLQKASDNMDIHDGSKGYMTRAEIDSTFNVVAIAGSETTATALSGVSFLLCTNLEIYQKVKDLVRGTFSSPEQITIAAVNQMPYLFAIIEETLRIYPPVAIGLTREAPATGARVIGLDIPPRTLVAVSQHAAYHSKLNFHRPEEFLPDRWMPNPPAEFANDKRGVLQPFSAGPRNCLGKNLAYAEMKLAVAHLVFAFDMELSGKSKTTNWLDQKVFSLWDKHPLMIKLTAVN